MMCQSVVDPKYGSGPCDSHASRTLFGVHVCGVHDAAWRRRLPSGQKIKVHPERTLPLDHGSGTSNQPPALERIGMRKVEPHPEIAPQMNGSLPVAQGGSIPTLCPHCGGRRADAQTGRCLGCGKRVCSPDLAREFGHPIYERPTPDGGAA